MYYRALVDCDLQEYLFLTEPYHFLGDLVHGRGLRGAIAPQGGGLGRRSMRVQFNAITEFKLDRNSSWQSVVL